MTLVRESEPIGVVIALPLECRSFGARRAKRLDTLQLGPRRRIRVSGAGPANAAAAADALVRDGARRLVSWGCAGALAEHLAPGDVVVASAVRSVDGTLGGVPAAWRERLIRSLGSAVPVFEGWLAESAGVVASPEAKRALRGATGALAVDMESAAVLRVAEHHQLPYLAVRAIADSATMALPATVLGALDEYGEAQFFRLLLGLARKPSDFRALLQLNRCFRRAIGQLSRVAALSGPGFAA